MQRGIHPQSKYCKGEGRWLVQIWMFSCWGTGRQGCKGPQVPHIANLGVFNERVGGWVGVSPAKDTASAPPSLMAGASWEHRAETVCSVWQRHCDSTVGGIWGFTKVCLLCSCRHQTPTRWDQHPNYVERSHLVDRFTGITKKHCKWLVVSVKQPNKVKLTWIDEQSSPQLHVLSAGITLSDIFHAQCN